MTALPLSPEEARQLVGDGALLVDIREPDEFAREHIPGAINLPLPSVAQLAGDGRPVVFHCRSGMRTAAHSPALINAAKGAPCYILEGGMTGWAKAGLPTRRDFRQPIEIMRQVQIVAGTVVLLGALLSFVSPAFAVLPVVMGAGLLFAGLSGSCGMATVLRKLPWNNRAGSL